MLDKNIQTNMGLAYDQINAELNGLSDVSKLFDVQPSLNKNAILDVYVEKGKIYTDSVGIININALGVSAIYTVDANGNYITFIGSTKVLFSIGNITVTSLAVPNTSIIIYVIIDLLRIESTSNFKSKLSLNAFVYHSGFIGSLLKSNETLQYNSINKFLINQLGYSLNGGIAISTSGSNYISSRLYVNTGDAVMYSGGFTQPNVIGFTSTGYVVLLATGIYDKIIIMIPAGVDYVIANNDINLHTSPILKKVNNYDADNILRRLSLNESNINSVIPTTNNLILKNCTKSNYLSTSSNITDRGMMVSLTGSNSNITLTTSKTLMANEFAFCRIKLTSDVSGWIFITTYTTGSEQTQQECYLEAGITYDLYLKQKLVITSGVCHFQIVNSNSYTINLTIKDLVLTFNSFDAYVDHDTKASLQNFNLKTVIVDKSGVNCHFMSINSAINFLKTAHDVLTEDYSIYIRNGVYDKEFRTGKSEVYPWAVVAKGANKISLIGQSRTNTVIKYTNTSASRLKVLDIGGECCVENMTIQCLNNGTYIDSSAGGHQACYCIHNDSSFVASSKYKTIVSNVDLYSECQSPVGAGLSNHQTQIYKNVRAVSNSLNGTSMGSIYVHNSAVAGATDMALELINNEIISKDGTKALNLPDTGLGDSYSIIPCTFQKNLLYSSGASETNVTDATHLINATSKLNSNSVLNK